MEECKSLGQLKQPQLRLFLEKEEEEEEDKSLVQSRQDPLVRTSKGSNSKFSRAEGTFGKPEKSLST
jgi:hypothetical protein